MKAEGSILNDLLKDATKVYILNVQLPDGGATRLLPRDGGVE